ncbi:uncharacterized protein LOC136094510 [Hydra vulgaris]|uniref:uncharacterized protein LOC136094510 n=1 Tax=Hydra vulgaris TaxID=6087 RepID=UPI0032EA5EA4
MSGGFSNITSITARTYNYNLAKHLSHLLSPHILKQFCTLDSFSFVEELKQINISTSGSHFLFGGKYYNQADGVAMGSPLVPILANIFVGFHEQTWINNCSFTAPFFINAQEFFKHLNEQHKNLKFTMEKEQDNQSFTKSFIPSCYKFGFVRCLIDRTFKINYTWVGFDKDVKNLLLLLLNNKFPQKIIEPEIKSYIDKKMNPSVSNIVNSLNIRYFKLPFIGIYSNYTKMKISKIVHKYCKDILIKLIFTTNKIQDCFYLKESLPKLLISHVVYKFSCAGCNASYIGETSRHLATRIND